jgi:hypothetical protein
MGVTSSISKLTPETQYVPLPKGYQRMERVYEQSNVTTHEFECKFEFAFEEKGEIIRVSQIKEKFSLGEIIKHKSGHGIHIFTIDILSTESDYVKDVDIIYNLVYDARQAYSDIHLREKGLSEMDITIKGLIKKVDDNGNVVQEFNDEKINPTSVGYSEYEYSLQKEIYSSEFKKEIGMFATLAPLEKENLFVKKHKFKNDDGVSMSTIYVDSPLFWTFLSLSDPFSIYLKEKKMKLPFDVEYLHGMADIHTKTINTFQEYLEEKFYSKFKKTNLIQSNISVKFRETGDSLARAIKNSIDKKYGGTMENDEEEGDIKDRHLNKYISICVKFNVTYCKVKMVSIPISNNIDIERGNIVLHRKFVYG